MDYKVIKADEEKWNCFMDATWLDKKYFNRALQLIQSTDTFSSFPSISSGEQLDDTQLETYQVVSIDFQHKKTRNTFLLNVKKQSTLLINGEIETTSFDLSCLNEFFQRQIVADKKAFKQGRICYPIYKMLRTVSKIITHRRKVYSVTFTGKRRISYHHRPNADTINFNLEDGCFRLNESPTKYMEYMQDFSKNNLLNVRKNNCFPFADKKINSDLATVLDSDKIKETWRNCEVTIYLDSKVVNILCGKGEKTKNRILINKAGKDINIVENPCTIPNKQSIP